MSRKPLLEPIEKILLEDAQNPDAWGDPGYVPMSRSPRPSWYGRSKHLELAAKFFLLSVLHRIGSEANLTLADSHDVDIAALLPSGIALTIDVKTLAGTHDWRVDSFKVGKHHFVAFVCFKQRLQEPDPALVPELYIWSSRQLQTFVTKTKQKSVSLELLAAKHNPTEALGLFATHGLG